MMRYLKMEELHCGQHRPTYQSHIYYLNLTVRLQQAPLRYQQPAHSTK
jgi:hypothetical protein